MSKQLFLYSLAVMIGPLFIESVDLITKDLAFVLFHIGLMMFVITFFFLPFFNIKQAEDATDIADQGSDTV